jgi:LacI family transcriptional regulator
MTLLASKRRAPEGCQWANIHRSEAAGDRYRPFMEGTAGRATMRDIALEVGVSVKSVSRVVNGEPGVSAPTAGRILAVMERLGYRRNDLARDLRIGAQTGTIGLVLRDPATRFYSGLIRGIGEATSERDILVLTASALTPHKERETILRLCARRVDGLLVVPQAADHSYLRVEQQVGVPVVFVDRPAAGLAADVAMLDNAGGARAGVNHLLLAGHRRIAFIGDRSRVFTIAERLRGWEQAHQDAGIEPDPALVRLDRHHEVAASAASHELLSLPDPPTAFFAANNRATIGVLRALIASRERRALVGFDDLDLADLVVPPLTVVAYDSHELGRRAAGLLLDRIDRESGPPRSVILPTVLVPRGSGEVPPPRTATRRRRPALADASPASSSVT